MVCHAWLDPLSPRSVTAFMDGNLTPWQILRILLFASTTKQRQKVYHILLNQLLTVISKQEVPFSVCMCVCTGNNFFPIETKFNTQVHRSSKDTGYVRRWAMWASQGLLGGTSKNPNNFSTTSPNFNLKVSLDRAYQDLKHCI